jgi:transcription antitermination factor NusG
MKIEQNEPFYACAAQTGQEFRVAQEIADLGAWAWCAKEIRAMRPAKSRKPVWTERPLWPGYVFAQLSPAQFFTARAIKGLHATKLQLNNREVYGPGGLLNSHDRIEAANAELRRKIEAQDAPPVDYKPNQALEFIDGAFLSRLGTFGKIVHKSGAEGYMLQVEVDGWPILVEPHMVKAAE